MHLTVIVVSLAWYFVLDQAPNARKPSPTKFYTALALLVVTTVVFRAEVLLILGPFVLHALWSGYATLIKTVGVVLISGLISLGKSARCPLW
jgi:alpha-1,6-mannosyltransferase